MKNCILLSGIILLFLILALAEAAAGPIPYPEEWGENLFVAARGTKVIETSPIEKKKYAVEHLIDGDAEEDKPYCSWKLDIKGPVFVVIGFLDMVTIDRFAFINDRRDYKTYHVKDVRVSVSDNGVYYRHVGDYTLTKGPEIQSFPLEEPVEGMFVKLEILSIHWEESRYAILEEFAAFGPPQLQVQPAARPARERMGRTARMKKPAPAPMDTSEHDVIEFDNGEIFKGKLLEETWEIQASYGKLSFAKESIASVTFEDELDRIETVVGDIISGFLLDKTIKFRLAAGPEFEARREKMRRIGFRAPETAATPIAGAKVFLKNGDVLCGTVTTPSIEAEASDIALIEFGGDDGSVAIVTYTNGKSWEGELQDEDIALTLALGPDLLIYRGKIDRIQFRN